MPRANTARGQTEAFAASLWIEINRFCHYFVIPALSTGLSKTLNLGQVFWLISRSGTFPILNQDQWRLLQAMGAAAHPETVSEKYSSGTVRDSHPCSLLNLNQQIPQFRRQKYKKDLYCKRQMVLFFTFSLFNNVQDNRDNKKNKQSHNGYQKTVGQEKDYYQDTKIKRLWI